MKRFLAFVILLTAAFACPEPVGAQQWYLTTKGGWGVGDVRLYPHWTTPPVWGKWNAGAGIFYYVGDSPNYYLADNYTGGIGIEVEYMQRGFQYAALDRDSERYTYGRSVQSIIVPLIWQPHFFLFDHQMRIFIDLGINAQYNLSSKEYYIDKTTGEVDEKSYEMTTTRDNRFGYGLCGGLGIGWNWSHWEIAVSGRYYFGYSDIVKPATVNPTTQFQRSPLDNIYAALNFSYHWGHDLTKVGAKKRNAKLQQQFDSLMEIKR